VDPNFNFKVSVFFVEHGCCSLCPEKKIDSWVSDSLGFFGFFGRIRPSYNGRNDVVVGRAAVIPFNII
jgi:hypothetical protein